MPYDRTMKELLGLTPNSRVDATKSRIESQLVRSDAAFVDQEHLHNNAIPIIRKQIQAAALEPDDLETVLPLFPTWEPSVALSVGDVVAHGGVLYEVVQAHTTQADWEPQNVPALFKSHAPAGTVPDWVQPLGGHDAYSLGARVMHNGQMWESTINANVWAPGAHGWVTV